MRGKNCRFGGKRFSSVLRHHENGAFSEQFGPFIFEIGLSISGGAIQMPVDAWRLYGVPLPVILAPRSVATEYEDKEGRFRFDVRLSLPVIGLLAHYKGWLKERH